MEDKSDIGLIGLAIMGANLALNMERNGYQVSVYNHTPERTRKFMEKEGRNKNFVDTYTPQQFVDSLERPRKIFLMIKAGEPVDLMIDILYPLLDYGDLIVDGGNSYYKDTKRRCDFLKNKGRLFIGCGVSGGAEGALWGPSMMPGGMIEGWPLVKNIFQKISAKAPDGSPCCQWIGPDGAGHFVKMVHNGIEYGDMQLIAESYFLLKKLFGYNNSQMSRIFKEWNEGKLSSYLIEITSSILEFKELNNEYLIDSILDTAGQKGTGRWSVESAMEMGVPLSVIATAQFERDLSAHKDERVDLSYTYPRQIEAIKGNEAHVNDLMNALYASKLISYAQGFSLLRKASQDNNWNLDYGAIASIWRAGCIIRSVFLDRIKDAYHYNPELKNLLEDLFFINEIKASMASWKNIVATAIKHEMPVSAHSSALNYFYGITSESLPTNLIQAQRDYFGSHMFERTDSPRGQFFHVDWNTTKQ
ncbi:MAG: decarboxylating NADP(+)-dependent phosphogluconate dehydrogenase [Bacteroidales bacterium]|nr:decarboxylating NADP(+)-dependent phosphogluconate dehydrogenase [Bacteroidales bacterium]